MLTDRNVLQKDVMTEVLRPGQYKTPPIEEALVEFRFVPGKEWDPTLPGKLHQHPLILGQYPGKPRSQKVIQAAFHAEPGKPPDVSVNEGVGRIQLVDGDGKRLISLGPDSLSVNVLRPYEGWERFRPRIETALTAYTAVANVTQVMRIGVRYINKVVLPHKTLDLEKFFRCGPPRIDGLPDRMASFLTRVEYLYDGNDTKLLLTHASLQAAPEDSSEFLLDLDVVWEGQPPLSVDTVMSTVERLHEWEGKAFEASITEETRRVFNET